MTKRTAGERRTTLVLDRDELRRAQAVLGTAPVRDTVNRALREVNRQAALRGAAALHVQRELAGRFHGQHRRPVADLLIAAIGELAGDGVVTWFFDRDLRVICAHTGQRG